jgi:hypothetical protein
VLKELRDTRIERLPLRCGNFLLECEERLQLLGLVLGRLRALRLCQDLGDGSERQHEVSLKLGLLTVTVTVALHDVGADVTSHTRHDRVGVAVDDIDPLVRVVLVLLLVCLVEFANLLHALCAHA